MTTCTCGHDEEEHGGDPEFPDSDECNVDDCDCVCYEEGDEEDEQE